MQRPDRAPASWTVRWCRDKTLASQADSFLLRFLTLDIDFFYKMPGLGWSGNMCYFTVKNVVKGNISLLCKNVQTPIFLKILDNSVHSNPTWKPQSQVISKNYDTVSPKSLGLSWNRLSLFQRSGSIQECNLFINAFLFLLFTCVVWCVI